MTLKLISFKKSLVLWDYKFQFITLAGFHNLNLSTFNLAKAYAETGMSAYASTSTRRIF